MYCTYYVNSLNVRINVMFLCFLGTWFAMPLHFTCSYEHHCARTPFGVTLKKLSELATSKELPYKSYVSIHKITQATA